MKKGNILALIAREAGLKAEDFRVLIALFIRSAAPGRNSADFTDLVAATALSPERVDSALSGLRSRGFIEIAEGGAGAGSAAPERTRPSAKPAHRPTLSAGIMDYDVNVEGLIRAGDALARGTRPKGSPPALASPSAPAAPRIEHSGWDPLTGEETRPAALRFMVWLRFVLSPEELEACERFAVAHRAAWTEFIDRFGGAKATGREEELLADLRRRLEARAGDLHSPPSGGGWPPPGH